MSDLYKEAFLASLGLRGLGSRAASAARWVGQKLAPKAKKPSVPKTTGQKLKSGAMSATAAVGLTVPFMGGETAARVSRVMSPPQVFRGSV